MDSFSKFVLNQIVPWQTDLDSTFTCDSYGLSQLVHQYNNSKPSLINRHRFRYLDNILSQHHQSSLNEKNWHFMDDKENIYGPYSSR